MYSFIFGCAGFSLLHGFFSSCSEQGPLPSCGTQASHCGGLSYCGAWAPGHTGFSRCSSWALEHRLSSCGAGALFLRGMWDSPGLGVESVSPVLAADSTAEPPGKPCHSFKSIFSCVLQKSYLIIYILFKCICCYACVLLACYVPAKSLQSYPTLCDPMDCSPPGSSVHGILQARILEWVAMSSSRGSSQPRD